MPLNRLYKNKESFYNQYGTKRLLKKRKKVHSNKRTYQHSNQLIELHGCYVSPPMLTCVTGARLDVHIIPTYIFPRFMCMNDRQL